MSAGKEGGKHMQPKHALLSSFSGATLLAIASLSSVQAAPLLIVGNDEKLLWDDQGKPIVSPAGKDSVVILDLADPESPKIVVNLPLKNSIVGPPVNLAIDPTNSIALVADSIDVTKDGDALKQGPDNKVYVIDLKANPPKLADTVTVGKQPSGLSFKPAGNLALVTNRADKSTYTKLDLPTGQWPYNVAVAPSGKIALTADNGGAGSSDGSVDTVSVVDLELNPIRITDRVVVGDGPEGLAISPKGDVAVAVILEGSNNKSAYFYKRNGSAAVLRIDGKKVTKVGDVELGGLPEGAAFTPDGKYLFVGNYLDQDLSILKVDGTKVTDTEKRFKLPGHPASVRMSAH